MNQQVTYRVGRGVPSPAPDSNRTLFWDWFLDFVPKVAFMALGFAAVVLTAGMDAYTLR